MAHRPKTAVVLFILALALGALAIASILNSSENRPAIAITVLIVVVPASVAGAVTYRHVRPSRALESEVSSTPAIWRRLSSWNME